MISQLIEDFLYSYPVNPQVKALLNKILEIEKERSSEPKPVLVGEETKGIIKDYFKTEKIISEEDLETFQTLSGVEAWKE